MELYDVDKIQAKLGKILSPSRLQHSLNVKEQAEILAVRLGADVHKAAVAGLLHDCARDLGYGELLNKAKKFGIILDNVTKKSPEIIHAVIGPEIAKREFGVRDSDVLSSIRYHTTGRENMSLLEKIIFIADLVEPSRSFPGVQRIRDLLEEGIDRAILCALDCTIIYLLENRQLIHEDTLKARNYLYLTER
jgi:predicted HD superfamily hydrolase involved in NAD metabolism